MSAVDADAQSEHTTAIDAFERLLQQRLAIGTAMARAAASSSSGTSRTAPPPPPTSGPSRLRKPARVATASDDDDALAEDVDDDGLASRLERQPPCIVGGTMREYQLEGLNWLISLHARALNGILADEMGLGKTLQSISLLGYLTYELKVKHPHLVVVPLSVLGNWQRELSHWCPSLRVLRLHGDKDERGRLIQEELVQDRFDVVLTTYETIASEQTALRKLRWTALVVDEAHRLKNEKARLSVVCRGMKAERRILLTGTPIQNNLHELWALLNFLYPEIFTSSEPFDDAFDAKMGAVVQSALEQLQRLLQQCMLRRLKTEVEKGLPPKTETKLFLPLTALQADWYKKLLLRDLGALKGASSQNCSIQNIVIHLRKVCNHPYLFDGIEPGPPYVEGEHIVTASGKLIVLDKLLRKLKDGGHRPLVFCTMTKMLDILEDYCRYRRFDYCRLDGGTAPADRERLTAEYNAVGSSKFVFLLSTRAGGLGINLATADTVILYDSDWNPQMDLQAQDRAHRIGQTRPVSVYRFVMESTLEQKIIERAERKLYLDRLLVEQGRLAVQAKGKSKAELMEMITFGADVVIKSDGAALTDADIDTLIDKGKERTVEMANKLRDDCRHSLANYEMETDHQKLYELDGVEYDAKGVADLVQRLRAAQRVEGGSSQEAMDESQTTESVVRELLSQNWSVARTLRLCPEPGASKREGTTMQDVVRSKLKEIAMREEAGVSVPENERDAWYTLDKKQAPDQTWHLVATLLATIGCDGISPNDTHARTVRIPHALCKDFDRAVAAPWDAAWRAFRSKQRMRRQGSASGAADENERASRSAAAAAMPICMEERPAGDALYAWGGFDWVSSASRASGKKSERSAFIMAVPMMLKAPECLPPSLDGVTIQSIACGGRHSMLLTDAGDVYAWGRGLSGCLGLASTGCAGQPQPLRALQLGGIRITSIACGGEHSVLLSNDGVVYSCGANKRGQLGLGHTDPVSVPQRMPMPIDLAAGKRCGAAAQGGRIEGGVQAELDARTVRSVSCGAVHTAVLLTDGTLLTCGAGSHGMLGQTFALSDTDHQDPLDSLRLQTVAVLRASSLPVVDVSCGGSHTLALVTGGQLYVFGAASWGRLGLGPSQRTDKWTPTLVKAASHLGVVAVSAGYEHSLLRSADGNVFQFGRVGSAYQSTPTQVMNIGPGGGGAPVESIAAGNKYCVAQDDAGHVWVWGTISAFGALGLGEREGNKIKSAKVPTHVEALEGRRVVQIAAGYGHIMALADSAKSKAKENMFISSDVRFPPPDASAQCEVCKTYKDEELVFCDWCNKAYHVQCHQPPLSQLQQEQDDWCCYDCKLERFSSCVVCGMQDEITSTLALCENEECPHFGCRHIECMDPSERPPLLVPQASSTGEEATAPTDSLAAPMDVENTLPAAAEGASDGGGGGGSGGTPNAANEGVEERRPEERRKLYGIVAQQQAAARRSWQLKDFKWWCDECAQTMAPERPPPAPTTLVPSSPLTPASRKLLQQYFSICMTPDEPQIRLLASVTDRTAAEVKTWFAERLRAATNEQRIKSELAKRKSAMADGDMRKRAAVNPLSGRSMPSATVTVHRQASLPDNFPVKVEHTETATEYTFDPAYFTLGGTSDKLPGPPGLPPSDDVQRSIDTERELGNQAFQRGDLSRSAQHYLKALYLDPTRGSPTRFMIHSNLSAVLASQRKWRDSLRHAQQSVILRPNFSKAWTRMGQAFANLNQLEKARGCFEYCLEIEPTNEAARRATRRLQEKILMGIHGTSTVPEAAADATRLPPQQEQRPHEPVATLEQPAPTNPGQPVPINLEQTVPSTLEPPAAINAATSAPHRAELTPKMPFDSDSTFSAIKLLLPAAATSSAPARANQVTVSSVGMPMTGQGVAVLRGGRGSVSIRRTAAAPARPAASATKQAALKKYHQEQGNAKYRARAFQEAVAEFSEAMRLFRESGEEVTAQLFSNRSAAFVACKMYDCALADADQCVASHPTWSKSHSRRANALHGMGRLEEAMESYKTALELSPGNTIVLQSMEQLKRDVHARQGRNELE